MFITSIIIYTLQHSESGESEVVDTHTQNLPLPDPLPYKMWRGAELDGRRPPAQLPDLLPRHLDGEVDLEVVVGWRDVVRGGVKSLYLPVRIIDVSQAKAEIVNVHLGELKREMARS